MVAVMVSGERLGEGGVGCWGWSVGWYSWCVAQEIGDDNAEWVLVTDSLAQINLEVQVQVRNSRYFDHIADMVCIAVDNVVSGLTFRHTFAACNSPTYLPIGAHYDGTVRR